MPAAVRSFRSTRLTVPFKIEDEDAPLIMHANDQVAAVRGHTTPIRPTAQCANDFLGRPDANRHV